MTSKRIPAAIDVLQRANADIIGLQEVTQAFLIQLLRSPWVQQYYFVSDGQDGLTVKPYGQLLLSKYPFHRYVIQIYII